MPARERVKQLIALVEQAKFVEAIERFYADDASMQENSAAPRRGKQTLVDFERKFLATLKSARTLPMEDLLVDGDRVVIRWQFEFTRADGSVMRLDELALQKWRGDLIVEERFYYDPAQMRG
ncbi:MAG: nuclear transport factor 2 family protein [Burkholderiales bacterium]